MSFTCCRWGNRLKRFSDLAEVRAGGTRAPAVWHCPSPSMPRWEVFRPGVQGPVGPCGTSFTPQLPWVVVQVPVLPDLTKFLRETKNVDF